MTDPSSPYAFESKLAKRVSWILVTKNRRAYAEKTLARMRILKKADDELIVIDADSTDGTRELMTKFDDIVDLFVSEPDMGEGHAVNKGVLLSSGKYIKEITDDDIIHEAGMEKAVRVMERHPEIDVLLCGGTKEKNGIVENMYVPDGVDYGRRVEDLFKYGCCGIGWLIRRRAIARIGLFSTTALSLDRDYNCQIIAAGGNLKFCRIKMYHHPMEDHSCLVGERREKMKEDLRRIERRYYPPDTYRKLMRRRRMNRLIMWPPVRYPTWPVRLLLRKLRTMSGIKPPVDLDYERHRAYVTGSLPPDWDGGFS